jgi:glucokinase
MGATQAGDRLAIGIDIGGTKIAGGVVAPDGEVLVRDKVPTPDTGDAIVSAVEALVAKLRAASPDVAAIGVGAAGLVEWPEGRIRWAPNNAYRDLPLRALLAEKTGLPVRVDNDANVAAWAEARFGAGEGSRDLVLIAVGTGIGGGLVLDGKVYRGATGMGATCWSTSTAPPAPAAGPAAWRRWRRARRSGATGARRPGPTRTGCWPGWPGHRTR